MLSKLSGQTLKANCSNASDPLQANLHQQLKVCGMPRPVLEAFYSAHQLSMTQSVLYSPEKSSCQENPQSIEPLSGWF